MLHVHTTHVKIVHSRIPGRGVCSLVGLVEVSKRVRVVVVW